MLDDLMYDGKDLQTNNKGAKKAHIDSGSMFIQIPVSEFNILKKMLIKADPTIREEQSEEGPVLLSNFRCQRLNEMYGDL